MSKAKEVSQDAQTRPLEALILECQKDRYKLSYAALRLAKEIKQKENLPDAIPTLIPRAMREILGGKTSIKDIEKLPMISKSTPANPPQAAPAPAPTITLNMADDKEEDEKPSKEDKE